QAFGIEIEPADRNDARQALREFLEHGGAALFVFMRRHEAGGLVIAEQPRRLGGGQLPAVDLDHVAFVNVARRTGQHRAVHRDAALRDPAFGLAARAQSRPCQRLGDPLAHFFAAAISASKIRVSPGDSAYSGCHSTPSTKRRRGSSIPSTMPSGARASTMRPGPASFTAW